MLELTGWPAILEVRQEGEASILTGRFPLNTVATRSNTGRVRKEVFRSGSMSWQVREFEKLQTEMAQVIGQEIEAAQKARLIEALEDGLEKRNTHFLVGHSYDKAIADMKTGNLAVNFTDDYVDLAATLPPAAEQPSWVRDAVLAVRGGQLRGISPGFQVTRKGAERLVKETGPGDALMREILDSTVYEYSLVSRPTYPLTGVQARADSPLEGQRRVWWQ